MDKIKELQKIIRQFTANYFMRKLFQDKELLALIIELNTGEQLYDRGIDSTGRLLSDIGGPYSPHTILIKEAKGQPTSRVTLKDTGEFYKSFKVILNARFELEITADPIKQDTDLTKEWGKDIIGLTDKSLEIVRQRVKIILQELIQQTIKQAA